MRFTMARPEVSCHPEPLLDGARSVVSAALCYCAPEAPSRGRGTAGCRATPGTTATRSCARSSTRSAGGSAAPTACSSTRTSTSTARPPPARGVGFYGKNTMLITRRHGSWVVLGTLVTDAELEPTPPLDADCGSCTLCIDACPTGALDEPGTLDATQCLSYWTQAPAPIPERYRARARRAGLRLRHLPGRLSRGTAASRSGAPDAPPEPRGRTSTCSLARGRRRRARRATTTGSTCRGTTRAGCGGTRSSRSATSAAAEHAPRSSATRRRRTSCSRARRVGARAHRGAAVTSAAGGSSAGSRSSASSPCRSRSSRSCSTEHFPAAVRVGRVGADAASSRPAPSRCSPRARRRRRAGCVRAGSARWSSTSRSLGASSSSRSRPGARRSSSSISSRRRPRPLRHSRAGPDRARDRADARRRSRAARAPTSTSAFRWTTSSSRSARLLLGLIVGWLVQPARRRGGASASARAEAEALRDELGRRADLLDAANRCARALNSSLDLDEAFARLHPRAARRCVPFDRVAIVLAEDGVARVMATAGDGRRRGRSRRDRRRPRAAPCSPRSSSAAQTVVPPRHRGARVRRGGVSCVALGLRSRVARAAARRRTRRSGCSRSCGASPTRSREEEIELVGLLGRLVATRRPEHARVRGRAADGRGAAAALGAARRLRLARLARAAHPDGGRDRLGADAPAALARARAGAARRVPRPDRGRDRPARGARRRGARHLADRRRHVQLPLRRRRPRARSSQESGRGRRGRPGRGAASRPTSQAPLPRVRGDARAAAPGARRT